MYYNKWLPKTIQRKKEKKKEKERKKIIQSKKERKKERKAEIKKGSTCSITGQNHGSLRESFTINGYPK